MREKYILNPFSAKILKTGLFVTVLAYFFVMLHIYNTLNEGIILMSDVYTMMEHISMTGMLTVAAALILDIHIKTEK